MLGLATLLANILEGAGDELHNIEPLMVGGKGGGKGGVTTFNNDGADDNNEDADDDDAFVCVLLWAVKGVLE